MPRTMTRSADAERTILAQIAENEKAGRQSTFPSLRTDTGFCKSTMSRCLSRLEADELIARDDGYPKLIRLTDKAKDQLSAAA